MNYLETGLPHTDLYRKKSDFVPPRYKPLCSLGRRYLGLEPPSKTEIHSFVNRLSQPKKQPTPEPEPPPKPSRGNRTSGSVRFSGRKRMTGNQIGKMVDRLTKRKTEVKDDEDDIKKKGTKKINKVYKVEGHTAERMEENPRESSDKSKERTKESSSSRDILVNTRIVPDETNSANQQRNDTTDIKPKDNDDTTKKQDDMSDRNENIAQFKEIEKKMLQYLRAKEERERAEMEARSWNPDQYNTSPLLVGGTQVEAEMKSRRASEEEEEEKRYESLYYRGVKTEIARKFFTENYKRPSIQINKVNKSESGTKSTKTSDSGTKTTKTILVFSPRRNSKLEDIQNRKPRFRSKTT